MDTATLQFVEFKDRLDAHIRAHAMPRNNVSPVDVLRRWTFLSEQFPRFLGAILSRISSPSAQCLVAKNIAGECGNGIKEEMHSLLLADMVRSALGAEQMRFNPGPLKEVIERKLDEISKMSAGEAIGLLIGLEAPAYDILALLRRSLEQSGMAAQAIDATPYMRIHQEIEKVHQDDSLAMAEMVRELGCPDAEIIKGGDSAVEFWSAWWAVAY
jgi:hypothetical protein